MHRSQFEQLIAAGLASHRPHAQRAHPLRSRYQTALPPNLEVMDRVAAPDKPHLSASNLRQAYRDGATAAANLNAEMALEDDPAVEPRPVLATLLSQLANHKSMTRPQLHALRRQLARCLHPDLVSAEDRLSATAEMARLNALIDNALEQHSR